MSDLNRTQGWLRYKVKGRSGELSVWDVDGRAIEGCNKVHTSIYWHEAPEVLPAIRSDCVVRRCRPPSVLRELTATNDRIRQDLGSVV